MARLAIEKIQIRSYITRSGMWRSGLGGSNSSCSWEGLKLHQQAFIGLQKGRQRRQGCSRASRGSGGLLRRHRGTRGVQESSLGFNEGAWPLAELRRGCMTHRWASTRLRGASRGFGNSREPLARGKWGWWRRWRERRRKRGWRHLGLGFCYLLWYHVSK